MFFALFAFFCLVLVTVFEGDEESTSHLACVDYASSVPLHNYAVQESQILLHNHHVSKQHYVALHNFWSGKE